MVIEIKMKMFQIISFSIYAIGVSHIIVSIFKFIFTLINLMAIIIDINMWLMQWLKFMYFQQWSLNQWLGNCLFFSCDQAAIWLVQSVRPSVRLSVRLSVRPSVTPFSPCSHHRIIIKFSGVITMVKSDVHAKGQGQRSKVKVTEVNTQLSRFRTLTPVWIYIWQWNHAHSWKQHRRGALLFFKVIHQISRSHGSKNRRIWPRLGVSGL